MSRLSSILGSMLCVVGLLSTGCTVTGTTEPMGQSIQITKVDTVGAQKLDKLYSRVWISDTSADLMLVQFLNVKNDRFRVKLVVFIRDPEQRAGSLGEQSPQTMEFDGFARAWGDRLILQIVQSSNQSDTAFYTFFSVRLVEDPKLGTVAYVGDAVEEEFKKPRIGPGGKEIKLQTVTDRSLFLIESDQKTIEAYLAAAKPEELFKEMANKPWISSKAEFGYKDRPKWFELQPGTPSK